MTSYDQNGHLWPHKCKEDEDTSSSDVQYGVMSHIDESFNSIWLEQLDQIHLVLVASPKVTCEYVE